MTSHKRLVDSMDACIRYEGEMAVSSRHGDTSDIVLEDDVYWVYLVVGRHQRTVTQASLAVAAERRSLLPGEHLVMVTIEARGEQLLLEATAMAATARARVGDPRHLYAARYQVDAEQLLKLGRMVDGLDVKSMPRESAILINSDMALRRARHVRPASSSSISPIKLVLLPAGHTFASDVVPMAVKCMLDGAGYVFHSVCSTGGNDGKGTGYIYSAPTIEHTEEDWHDYWAMLILQERVHHHDVRRLLIDCESCVRDEACCRRLSLRLGAHVERAGGDDHEKIGDMEGVVKTITRRTEMSMYRAKSCVEPVPDGMMVKCRIYTASTMNHVFKDGVPVTRIQMHTSVAPSARSTPRPLFWAECSVNTIGTQSGPKGLMNDDRSSHERLGRLIGISAATDGRSFATLYAVSTRRCISREPTCLLPHDEQAMLNAGIALGVATADANTQVDIADLPALISMAPMPRAPAVREVIKFVTPHEQLPRVGDDVKVLWQDSKGDTYRWHKGTCVDERPGPPHEHRIEYTGVDDTVWHDLARDAGKGAHPWMLVTQAARATATAVDGGDGNDARAVNADTTPPPRAARTTRSQTAQARAADARTPAVVMAVAQRLTRELGAKVGDGSDAARWAHERACAAGAVRMHHVWTLLERMDTVLAATDTPCEVHDALVEEAFGDDGDQFTTRQCGGSLDKARARLYAAVRDATDTDPVCVAATAMIIMTAAGSNSQMVEIADDTGAVTLMRTPRTCRDMLDLPDAVQWLRAARDAIELSILSLPGNHLISEREAMRLGQPIADMVPTCKYKRHVDKRMDKRKVRLSWDEARLLRKVDPATRESILQRAAYTMPIGDAEQCCLLATAEPSDEFTLADWKDAYGLGKCDRGVRLVRPPKELDVRTENGEPAVLAIVTSLWGERAAGFEWEMRRDEHMAAAGWLRPLDAPAIFYNGEHRAGVIIDDMLIRTRGSREPALELVAKLNALVRPLGGQPLVVTFDVQLWGGMMISRSPCKQVITSSMPHYVESVAIIWLPGYLETGTLPAGVPRGEPLKRELLALKPVMGGGTLTRAQRDVMSLAMVIRWISLRVARVLRYSHLISRVQHRACERAMPCALGVLALACDHRREGRSWGLATADAHVRGVLKNTYNDEARATIRVADGEPKLAAGAPVHMEGASDVNWGIVGGGVQANADGHVDLIGADVPCADCVALAVTINGATVLLTLAMLGVFCGSSAEGEGLGLLKLSDKVVYLRTVVARLGKPQPGPTMLLCDAEAALRVAAGQASVSRLRHALRRSAIVTQRVREDEVALAHLPDACQVVDFLTKWVAVEKEEASIAYLSGFLARAAVEAGAATPHAVLVMVERLADAVELMARVDAGGA